MTRRRDPMPISDALSDFTESIQPATALASVQKSWPLVVGEAIAKWSTPVSETNGVLMVRCDDSVVAHELSMMADQLLVKLREIDPDRAPKKLTFSVA